MILPISVKKIIIGSLLTTGLAACGGGSSDGGETTPEPQPTPSNSAPTISTFTAQASDTTAFAVTFAWSVTDSDNDALSCVLSTGDSQADIEVADCKTTTSTSLLAVASLGSDTTKFALNSPAV